MARETKYTSEEVSRHCTRGDSWVSVDGAVYDVSRFSDHHPGGCDVLLDHCGGDVSELMRSEFSHAHSEAAYSILSGLKIGELMKENKVRIYSQFWLFSTMFSTFCNDFNNRTDLFLASLSLS